MGTNNNHNSNSNKMSPHKIPADGGQRSWLMGSAAFEARMPHHDGIKALWETKWKFPCTKSVYPFHDGKYEDFEPIFAHLMENEINDGTAIEYTQAFFGMAEDLTAQGDVLAARGQRAEASEYYLRACCVYRIARFPYITARPEINCPIKWKAWEAQKAV